MRSQKQQVLWMLKRGPVCSTSFLAAHIPRAAARISELRKEGFNIETRPCTRYHQHRTHQVEYVLHARKNIS